MFGAQALTRVSSSNGTGAGSQTPIATSATSLIIQWSMRKAALALTSTMSGMSPTSKQSYNQHANLRVFVYSDYNSSEMATNAN